ncbi:PD-(D/E)XK nuclease family protein [Alkalinema sp. FACHB-956]|uniref:PD-(D/E)XK nuclease family protein n=1 Tax=Alkalinema sp. FACHB-956 TaxID=2692768 RepID=UPI001687C421|nr:PD-(D/E)XK nuclease family protein [Alkalinema sp. FACHB-956]MBD2329452.1 PD-(D/E)XK nuclease family protein [Alkalinema sp. FACHB-956]
MRLAQGQLALLSSCPRKFQYGILEQLAVPTVPEDSRRLAEGNQFHALLQQWDLGLPIDPLVQTHPTLQTWFDAFVAASPQILTLAGESAPIRQSEQSRTIALADHVLVAVYDLLLLGNHQAQILDWKTYPKPRNATLLANQWQTRLYLYLLAETSPYPPDALAMTYWFFQGRDGQAAPQSVTIPWDQAHHDRTRQELQTVTDNLSQWLNQYEGAGQSFPQVDPASPLCKTCAFAVSCQRHSTLPLDALSLDASPEERSPLEWDSLSWETIAEIPI